MTWLSGSLLRPCGCVPDAQTCWLVFRKGEWLPPGLPLLVLAASAWGRPGSAPARETTTDAQEQHLQEHVTGNR